MDRDGTIVAYNWSFGDGTHASGPVVTHQYAKSGTYRVDLMVMDDSTTNTDTQSDSLSVRVNEPPVANAGPDQLVTASLVQFDGSASGDADDSISVYAWDFGDGQAGDGPTPTHVYAEPGTYDVTLVVTDASETIRNTAEDAMQVVVNARPIADAGPDLVAAPGETLTFQGTRSLDPDGDDRRVRDGTSATARPRTARSRATPSTSPAPMPSSSASRTIPARTRPSTTPRRRCSSTRRRSPKPGPMLPPRPATRSASRPPRPSTATGRSPTTAGTSPTSPSRWTGRRSRGPSPRRGSTPAQLTVTDDSGASNGVAVDSLRIAINHQPVADAGPRIVTDATTITFDGTRSLDADGDPLTYAWNFGDGSTGTGAIVTHTYATGGTYPGGAHGRRRHGAQERLGADRDRGGDQPRADRDGRREPAGLHRRHRRARRQQVVRRRGQRAPLRLGLRRRYRAPRSSTRPSRTRRAPPTR